MEKNQFRIEWKNLFRGIAMGISDLIPGVSGGTIAVILGIYNRLLEAISGFFSREWKRHIGFLIPLAIGMGGALLSFSRLMEYLLREHTQPTHFFFMGLVIGVLPLIYKEADVRRNFKLSHFIILILSGIIVASMAWMQPDKVVEPISEFSTWTWIFLFISGWLASMAMLLPGISGSFILLLLGVYPTALSALSNFNIPLIAVIGSGVIIGFIVSSKGIQHLLSHYSKVTYASVIGLVLGSLFIVYPGIPTDLVTIFISVLLMIMGIALVSFFGSRQK